MHLEERLFPIQLKETTPMRSFILFTIAALAIHSVSLFAQVLPEGSKIRLRSDTLITSSTAQSGQRVSFTVAEDVEVDNKVFIERGAVAVGTITRAEHKKSFGRSGKIDFNLEYVKSTNGERVPLRAITQRIGGKSKSLTTKALLAGGILIFPPAAIGGFFIKGSDIIINPGQQFDTFTDGDFNLRPRNAKLQIEGVEDSQATF
ncbi:MAG: hypothetical protein ACK6DX_03005 [Acidobacteriota bacterium]